MPDLPEALGRIETRPLLTLTLTVNPPTPLGRTPLAERRVAVVTGGRFESQHDGLNGHVHGGGSDWLTSRDDGVTGLDVRLVLETDAGERIGMSYRGYRHGPEAVMKRLAAGEAVDPAEYYFRAVPFFETASERFGWLNRTVCVATGYRVAAGPVYNVFEVL